MKTTVEINESLLREAKTVAAKEGTSVRVLIEEGLRHALKARTQPAEYRMRDASFEGDGLVPELEGATWAEIRERAYEGRGS